MCTPAAIPEKRRPHGFAAKLAHGLTQALEHALEAESFGARQGLLQGLDPRIKLAGCGLLILGGVLAKSLIMLAVLFLCCLSLAYASQIPLARLAKQVWLGVLFFTGVIALPAVVLVPGQVLWHLPLTGWPISLQGLRSAAFLIGRAETSATLAVLLVLTTPWPHVLKAMRSLGMPVVLVAILGMTHRYIFVLLHTAMQMFEARRSRIAAPMLSRQKRQMTMAAVGVLLDKSIQLSGDIHLAMISRGYRGDIHLLDEFRTRQRDWWALGLALIAPTLIVWLQA
ncbi:cobalt ECF transporter T component CbiQ [Uliginosibacterium gangwonense]|uniref:cobalt ECF transporter T component CbiQ n=1 Tax=Uliginosibacterium gangwonense TaxID=392736 RepID=UPI00037C7844|nr:cobalt ECF transporter T component CbiQ [Uliginosibacterium gangwonense]